MGRCSCCRVQNVALRLREKLSQYPAAPSWQRHAVSGSSAPLLARRISAHWHAAALGKWAAQFRNGAQVGAVVRCRCKRHMPAASLASAATHALKLSALARSKQISNAIAYACAFARAWLTRSHAHTLTRAFSIDCHWHWPAMRESRMERHNCSRRRALKAPSPQLQGQPVCSSPG